MSRCHPHRRSTCRDRCTSGPSRRQPPGRAVSSRGPSSRSHTCRWCQCSSRGRRRACPPGLGTGFRRCRRCSPSRTCTSRCPPPHQSMCRGRCRHRWRLKGKSRCNPSRSSWGNTCKGQCRRSCHCKSHERCKGSDTHRGTPSHSGAQTSRPHMSIGHRQAGRRCKCLVLCGRGGRCPCIPSRNAGAHRRHRRSHPRTRRCCPGSRCTTQSPDSRHHTSR
mmetsp:Transcript_94937/g.163799  ORF Transcript_94937/g.163799 Transcript_94937/m.163799 type:complete len:220 (+) Transcript_94937:13347-14006(+)